MNFVTLKSDPTSRRAALLLPGWATDHRVFDLTRFTSTVIAPVDLLTADIADSLVDYLDTHGITTVDVYGWSLGGATAIRLARTRPERIGRLVLAGLRPHYPAVEVEEIRRQLIVDNRECLLDFYRRCFLPSQREDYRRFHSTLADEYLRFDVGALLSGLDYLEDLAFDASDLAGLDATILHGSVDVIAPVDEIAGIATVRVISNAAHAAFLYTGSEGLWRG